MINVNHGSTTLAPDALSAANSGDIHDVSFFNGRLAEAIENLPEHLLHASEIDLSNFASPTPTDYGLRQRVTNLIRTAKNKGETEIETVRVYENLVARPSFFEMLKIPAKVAWMIRPVVTHEVYYDALHKLALKKMWQILEKHEIDPKYLPQILKLAETAGNRMHGPVVQKIQMAQKQEITHISGQPLQDVSPEDPDLLEAKIREMQGKLSRARPAIEIEARNMIDKDED